MIHTYADLGVHFVFKNLGTNPFCDDMYRVVREFHGYNILELQILCLFVAHW